MKVAIKDKIYDIAYSFRAVLMFEKTMGKMFTLSTITDQLTFYYCILCACNEDVLTFEEFVDSMNAETKSTFDKLVIDSFGEQKKTTIEKR